MGLVKWTVAEIVEATGGTLVQGDPSQAVRSISTDSRGIEPGDCFVALKGERHDAHDYVGQALSSGAGAVVVSGLRPQWGIARDQASPAFIHVRDTLHALGELARFHRRRFRIPLVGIGGSNGKTSTKEMVYAILSGRRTVLKNPGNLNNLIGVPLTLLKLTDGHEAAVIEMGINVPGEMARLADIVAPTVGLLTNIHPAHLEGLGSLESSSSRWATTIRPSSTGTTRGFGRWRAVFDAARSVSERGRNPWRSGCLGRLRWRMGGLSFGSRWSRIRFRSDCRCWGCIRCRTHWLPRLWLTLWGSRWSGFPVVWLSTGR